jgi:SAM-dependent methyltransferase
MPDPMPTTSHRFKRQLIGAVMVMILLPGAWPAHGQTAETGQASRPCLQSTQIRNLEQYLASTGGAPDSYDRVAKAAFDSPLGHATQMTAFEENQSFVFAVAGMQSHESTAPDGRLGEKVTSWVRRLIILNASTFIVDDEFDSPISPGMNVGCISSPTAPQVSGGEAHMVEASGQISLKILFPNNVTYEVRRIGQGQAVESYLLEISPKDLSLGVRFLQILHVGTGSQAGGALQSELTPANGNWKLTVTDEDRIFRLTLPPPAEEAGDIAITTLEGKTLVARRPFPSGILPHGPEGSRLLEYWDSAYRHKAPAPWDIGRPADELQKVVAGGKVGRCRVVDMCCGSGTDAIYLASQGFDVTGIDVSPTALSQAQQKAHDANVSVHWVLADTLAPPDLKPFDFLYDRACYHVVRKQNLAAYIETLRRFSHPGTYFLLLAARSDDLVPGGNWGVTEDELRSDFHPLFDIEWLREISLEINRQEIGPPAWSVFLKRKAGP